MILRNAVKKHICVLGLAAAMILSAAIPAGAASVSDFGDVSSGAWYYDAVAFVTEKGLFNGVSDTVFKPNGTMTRGMFITVLGRFANVDPEGWKAGTVNTDAVNIRSGPGESYDVIDSANRNDIVALKGGSSGWYKVSCKGQTGYIMAEYVTPQYHSFNDVDYSAYYAGYAIWGYEAGIVSGMGSADIFAPNAKVTREQICKLLNGYAAYAGYSFTDTGSPVTFTDQDSISTWAVDDVAAMQRAGIVVGETTDAGSIFRPGSSATRAETAIIFQRLSEAINHGHAGTEPEATPEPTPEPTPTAGPDPEADPGDVAGDYTAPSSAYGESLGDQQLAEVKQAVKSFLDNYYDPAGTDYDNVKAAHDYLVDTVSYQGDPYLNESWTAWGALVYHEATCAGYARAFKALCDGMGIECIRVESNNSEHEWNEVKVDGEWYIVDVQYSDLSIPYRYFLCSDEKYAADGRTLWDTSSVPPCPRNYGE